MTNCHATASNLVLAAHTAEYRTATGVQSRISKFVAPGAFRVYLICLCVYPFFVVEFLRIRPSANTLGTTHCLSFPFLGVLSVRSSSNEYTASSPRFFRYLLGLLPLLPFSKRLSTSPLSTAAIPCPLGIRQSADLSVFLRFISISTINNQPKQRPGRGLWIQHHYG
jgi:hypothetical protein